jgi:hypothetical protein
MNMFEAVSRRMVRIALINRLERKIAQIFLAILANFVIFAILGLPSNI